MTLCNQDKITVHAFSHPVDGYWLSKVEFRELKTHDTLEEIIDFTTSPLIIERVVNFAQTASEEF